MMIDNLLFVGTTELVVIAGIILLFFGEKTTGNDAWFGKGTA